MQCSTRSFATLVALLVGTAGLAAGKPARLPAEAFLAAPVFLAPVFSPDARQIAVLTVEGAGLKICVRSVDNSALKTVGRISEPNVEPRWLRWESPTRVLLGAEIEPPEGPLQGHRVFAFDTDTGVQLTGEAGSRAQQEWDLPPQQDAVIHWQHDDPTHALVQYRDRGQAYPSVKLMDIDSGDVTSVVPSEPGIQAWYADHDGAVRAGAGYVGSHYVLVARMDPHARFEKIEDVDGYGEAGLRFAGFGFDPATLYVWKLLGGKRALYEYNLAERRIVQLVFARPDVDVDGLVFNEGQRKLIAVDYIADGPERQFLDEEAQREQDIIDQALPGAFNQVTSLNRTHRLAIVLSASDTHPPAYYLLQRAGKSAHAELLLSAYPGLSHAQLAPMRAVTYRARDGLEISAYLTIPVGLPSHHLPLIVVPHGGPMIRDCRQFDPEVQFLANRGFAVLQMNFRGSGGYGEPFRLSGFHRWGMAMQDDITDGVYWVMRQGIADPDRIGIYGASYGGYAALMALEKTPELYRAGASYAGVTSLPMFVAENRKRFRGYDRHLGNWADPKQLQTCSPLEHVGRIRVPVLLAHGRDDKRVPIKHSQLMAEALGKLGKPVDYIEFPDERHGFVNSRDQGIFFKRLGAFFEKNLAPRARG